jgi:hypothetical protein
MVSVQALEKVVESSRQMSHADRTKIGRRAFKRDQRHDTSGDMMRKQIIMPRST